MDYYPTFSMLLNETLQAARSALGGRMGSHYKYLCFSVYDRVTQDGLDGSHALNPDLVGCDREINGRTKVPWHKIHIPVEVKSSWPDMVAQVAMYTRCMFAVSSGRQYALVIAFNHASTEVRFLFFHRSGLTASPAFNLKKDTGLKGFVAAMIGLASVKDRVAGGMDNSFDNVHIALPVSGLWKVDGWLFVRNCICGQGTQVARVFRASQKEEPKMAHPKHRPPGEGAGGQSGRATRSMIGARLHTPVVALPEIGSAVKLEQVGGSGQKATSRIDVKAANKRNVKAASGSRTTAENGNKAKGGSMSGNLWDVTDPETKIERIQRKPETNALVCHDEILDLDSENIPSKLVVKDSWPLVGRNNEASMYEAASGLLGVPEVLVSYKVKGPDGNVHRTTRFIPADSTYWNRWDSGKSDEAGTDPEREDRVQIRHLFKTEGRDLLNASSPHELLEGILHAMIVSDKTQCIGVLTDGDHAIEWREIDQGTLPFMSLRLVRIWAYNRPYHHTAIDDLESFLWLTIWCVYCIIEERSTLDPVEAVALEALRSPDVKRHAIGRSGILIDMTKDPIVSPLVRLLQPLLSMWRDISERAADEISALLESSASPDNDKLRSMTFSYFGEYLEAGFSQLRNLPTSWKEYFPDAA